MSEVLTLASRKALAAEDLADTLSHWQVLDIVYVQANGRMQTPAHVDPWKPTKTLIELGILKPSAVRTTVANYLVPGNRFRPVLEALRRSGRVRQPEEVVL